MINTIKRKKGLTLMEILFVFLLLSFIGAISVVAYNKNVAENEITSSQMEAKAMTDSVLQYIQLNNGKLPTNDAYSDGYASTPVLLDINAIGFLLSKDVEDIEGNYYIYGYSNEVFYDLPISYVYDMYKKYEADTGTAPLIDNDKVDTKLLYDEGYLPYDTITSYIIDGTSLIQEPKE